MTGRDMPAKLVIYTLALTPIWCSNSIDVHGEPVGRRPLPMVLAERRVHVRLLAGGDGGIAILVPEEGHRHAATSHLPFHMLMVDGMLVGVLLGLGREEDSLQRGVIHLLRQRPADPRGPGPVRHALDRVRRASDRESDVFFGSRPTPQAEESHDICDHTCSFLSMVAAPLAPIQS